MSVIIIPEKWTKQPTGPVEVEWNSKLSAGIVFAYTPTIPVNIALGSPLVYAPTVRSARVRGLSIIGSGSASYAKFAATDTKITGSYSSFSLSSFPSDWVPSCAFSQGVAYSSSWSIRYYIGGGTKYVIAPGIGLDVGVGSGATAGEHCVAFSVKSGATNGASVWWNGIETYTATGTPESLSGSRSILVARSEDVSGPTHQGSGAGISLSLAWNRALEGVEIRELNKNPWQIFKPRNQVIYSLPLAPQNRNLSCAVAAYVVTGVAATLTSDVGGTDYPLTCTVASFTVGSNATNLNRQLVMPATVQAFTVTGYAQTYSRTYAVQLVAQSFTVTGNTTNTLRGLAVPLTAQAFTLTGPPPGLLRGLVISTGPNQTFALAGIAVTLTPFQGFSILTVDGDDSIYHGQTGVVILPNSGAFRASGNRVTIEQSGVRRNQTVTAESTTSITITADLTGFTVPGTIRLHVHRPKV